MAKAKTGPNPKATKCVDCGAEFPSRFALKEHRWTCRGPRS
jgi:hypothetical protein